MPAARRQAIASLRGLDRKFVPPLYLAKGHYH
jgi:hypothetical protein